MAKSAIDSIVVNDDATEVLVTCTYGVSFTDNHDQRVIREQFRFAAPTTEDLVRKLIPRATASARISRQRGLKGSKDTTEAKFNEYLDEGCYCSTDDEGNVEQVYNEDDIRVVDGFRAGKSPHARAVVEFDLTTADGRANFKAHLATLSDEDRNELLEELGLA